MVDRASQQGQRKRWSGMMWWDPILSLRTRVIGGLGFMVDRASQQGRAMAHRRIVGMGIPMPSMEGSGWGRKRDHGEPETVSGWGRCSDEEDEPRQQPPKEFTLTKNSIPSIYSKRHSNRCQNCLTSSFLSWVFVSLEKGWWQEEVAMVAHHTERSVDTHEAEGKGRVRWQLTVFPHV